MPALAIAIIDSGAGRTKPGKEMPAPARDCVLYSVGVAFARIPRGVGWGGESALPEGSVESLRSPCEVGGRINRRVGCTAVPAAANYILYPAFAACLDLDQAQS